MLAGIRAAYRELFRRPGYALSAAAGLGLMAAGYGVNYFAGRLATANASNWVGDIILSNVPRVDTMAVHVWGPVLLTVLATLVTLAVPRYIPVVTKGIALIVFLRCAFINLTHLGIYHDAPEIEGPPITFGGDLFFSNHTGIPVLLAIIYWRRKALRYGFLVLAMVMGAGSLLGHIHYSIDVFAAPFFAFGTYHLARFLFPRDFALAEADPGPSGSGRG